MTQGIFIWYNIHRNLKGEIDVINLVVIGTRIKKLRENSNLSNEVLSEFLDIDIDTLSKIESGETPPTADMVYSLSDLFFCSIDYILFGDGNEPKCAFAFEESNPTVDSLTQISRLNRIAKNQFFMDELWRSTQVGEGDRLLTC